jgi:AmmeMemoRadiSam system protein A
MYSDENRKMLLDVAHRSIKHGLGKGRPLKVSLNEFPAELREKRATFVTLKMGEHLRGCIGVLEAIRPLVEDVVSNAYAAAFRDPRFQPVTLSEFDKLHLSISVLSPSEPVSFTSEDDLLSKIRPGVDGLILQEGSYQGTFLPAVWESLPNAKDFLTHLKLKAGLPADHWSDRIKIFRYTTEAIE